MTSRRPLVALAGATVLTGLLWLVPFGGVIGLPLLWLSTWAHESGHGLAMLLAGGRFEHLSLYLDGSGVAHGTYAAAAGPWVSLGGLVGPACCALALFVAGAFRTPSRAVLVLCAALGLASLLVVDTAFGAVFVAAFSALLLGLAWRLSTGGAQVVLLFLAVQLSLSVFSRADYLFAATAKTGAGEMPSDVAQIASAWGGLRVAWGAAIGAFSVVVLAVGLGALLAVDALHARGRARAKT